ncbi:MULTISPECIES: hypothetical protein [unclassified Streptomyces]|uniref:hypothetical protein n=1 Tax=unclassified Streptomyces TaxID=2593676 RepID=UPI003714402F
MDLVVGDGAAGAPLDEAGEAADGELVVTFVPEVQLASGELAADFVEQATASGVEDGDPLGADALVLRLLDQVAGHSGVVRESSLDLFEVDVAWGCAFAGEAASGKAEGGFGGGDDVLAAAVVDLEFEISEVRSVCQLGQVLGVGSGEAVDGLVGVSDGEDGDVGQVAQREDEFVEDSAAARAELRRVARSQELHERSTV